MTDVTTIDRLEAEIARLRAQVTELQTDNTRLVEERRVDEIRTHTWKFHAHMGMALNTVPQVPDEKTVRNRLVLGASELFEQLCACFPFNVALEHAVLGEIQAARMRVNLPALVDAWADSNFLNDGTALLFGVDMKPHQREVLRSNLTKKRANLQPNGRILKDADYSAPDIERILREQGWQGP
jgi:predicted HAD superfamily Cof-like phosphohydrolase